jgi:invasion protein IalB
MIRILAGFLCLLLASSSGGRTEDTSPTISPGMTPTAAPDAKLRMAVVSIAPEAENLPPLRITHGDWQLRCSAPAASEKEQCVLMQSVVAAPPEDAGIGLTVIMLKLAGGGGLMMRVLAPSGVLLPSGLGLMIDNSDIGRAAFVKCPSNGCIAEVMLDAALIDKLKAGKAATFIIFQTPEEGIGIPISLNGFAQGFANLR